MTQLLNFLRNIRVDFSLATKAAEMRPNLGFRFQNHPAASDAMENGTFEQNETNWFETQLGTHDVFVNIGANTGFFLLKAACAGVRSIGFEPEANNVKFLLRNVQANALGMLRSSQLRWRTLMVYFKSTVLQPALPLLEDGPDNRAARWSPVSALTI